VSALDAIRTSLTVIIFQLLGITALLAAIYLSQRRK
jgi:hypothetical protein